MYILHKTEMNWIEYVVDAVHGKKSMSIVVPEIQEEQCDFQPGSATLYTLEDIQDKMHRSFSKTNLIV